MKWIVFRCVIARSPVAGKDAVCIRVCIGVVVFRFIKTRRHHDLMTWNQPHRRFNSYTSILLIEFRSTRGMIKISSHFIPVFILLGDLIISLSLYADWWTKKWILWLYFWVLSVSFKILQLRVKTCIEDISTFIISYVFLTYNYLNKCPHWTNYQK